MQALENLERCHRQDANTAAQIHAFGWSGLFNGFGGKDSRLDAMDLMPFPGELKYNKLQLMPRTRRVAIQLINDGKIPAKVAQLLMSLPEIRDGVKVG